MVENTADWSARLSAWRISGKSGLAWCRDNAISYDQFKYWQKKLLQVWHHKKSGQFVPLKVASTLASTPLRLECNGVYLHVSSGFDPLLLREVVAVLRES
jgi:hypothetical protein